MANSSAAPSPTPHSFKSEDDTTPPASTNVDEAMYQQNLFYMTVLNMSWQLAIAVLVPIVGGSKLDDHFGTAPWLTLAGLALALALSIMVVKTTIGRAMKQAMHQDKKGSKT
jgi:F0F1-type ATP synthase assembly protein I